MQAKPKHRLMNPPTSEPPWERTGGLNAPLQSDLCQQMYVAALHQAINGRNREMVPASLPVAELRQLTRRYGPQIYVADETVLAHLFGELTLALYQAIEALYCSRLKRTGVMVWRILDQMARATGGKAPPYEAVWIICEYLARKRDELTAVTQTHLQHPWWLVELRLEAWLLDPGSAPYQPTLICVLETQPARVLASWVGPPQQRIEGGMSALYDALVSLRVPAPDGAGGLQWQVPSSLQSELPLSEPLRAACASLALEIEPLGERSFPFLEALRSRWDRDLAQRKLTTHQLMLLFDTHLARHHGYGPLRARRERDQRFRGHLGYNREPAWQFPALRSLLPHVPARIAANGSIPYGGLHYVDELLAYWPESAITLVRSPATEAFVWVYLEGEILCQAGARELQRRDGTYRPNRPGR